MTIAFWCVLAAGFIPYIWVSLAKLGGGKYDNNAPREFVKKLEGWRKRAAWAETNSFEAFPFFAAAVIIGHIASGPNDMVNNLAMAFVACRLVYGFLYIYDLATLRSLVWTGGVACIVGIFIVSAG